MSLFLQLLHQKLPQISCRTGYENSELGRHAFFLLLSHWKEPAVTAWVGWSLSIYFGAEGGPAETKPGNRCDWRQWPPWQIGVLPAFLSRIIRHAWGSRLRCEGKVKKKDLFDHFFCGRVKAPHVGRFYSFCFFSRDSNRFNRFFDLGWGETPRDVLPRFFGWAGYASEIQCVPGIPRFGTLLANGTPCSGASPQPCM